MGKLQKVFLIVILFFAFGYILRLNRGITIIPKDGNCSYFQKYSWGVLYSELKECKDGQTIKTIFNRDGSIRTRQGATK